MVVSLSSKIAGLAGLEPETCGVRDTINVSGFPLKRNMIVLPKWSLCAKVFHQYDKSWLSS